jgi:peptidoglycan/LPS O-acetylase OafA/YrhL
MGDWVLSRLYRVTSGGKFIPEIDGLRFVAVLSVVLFHSHMYLFANSGGALASPVWAGLSWVMLRGWFGVQLFFAISGFILALPFAQQHLGGAEPVSLKKYFLRRLTRLEPPYLINLTVMLAIALAFNGGSLRELAWPYLASSTYVHNLAYQTGSLINGVAWSLEIEVQFYILAPLLACVFLIRRPGLRRGVLVAVVAAMSVRNWLWPSAMLGLTLVGQLKYFMVGFLLADVYLTTWNKAPAKHWRWDAIGLAAWCAMPAMFTDDRLLEFALPAAILLGYLAAFRGRLLNRFFAYPWVAAVGGMCYTIYLYHNPCIAALNAAAGTIYAGDCFPLAFAVRAAVILVGVAAAGAGLFLMFEKPFMRKDWPARLAGWVRLQASRWRVSGRGRLVEVPVESDTPAPVGFPRE